MENLELLLDKTSIHFWEKDLKFLYFFFILISLFLVGCSFVPMQKAGANALTEAKCLYEKNIDFKSDKLNACLKGNSE
jgi:predicted negative regulator of RcsB-dependent stress response